MKSSIERKAVGGLKRFIKRLTKAGVITKEAYREWCKKNESLMEKTFWYQRETGMPSVTSLVSAFFHPSQPLIGLNYTPVAHNTLHHYHSGWTLPLRQCRGIIFDSNGDLVAKAFNKFFNYGEHGETSSLPNVAFVAT